MKHLILVDPWGFVGRDESPTNPISGIRGWAVKKLASFRALSTMRMVGPFGLRLFRKIRQDFEDVYYQSPESPDVSG